MLFVGKLHSAHLFQIDSELVLSNATPSTQELRQSWIRLETGGGVKCVNIVKSNAITLPEEACQVVREKAKGKGVKVIIVVLRIIIHQLAGKDFGEVKLSFLGDDRECPSPGYRIHASPQAWLAGSEQPHRLQDQKDPHFPLLLILSQRYEIQYWEGHLPC